MPRETNFKELVRFRLLFFFVFFWLTAADFYLFSSQTWFELLPIQRSHFTYTNTGKIYTTGPTHSRRQRFESYTSRVFELTMRNKKQSGDSSSWSPKETDIFQTQKGKQ